MSVIAVNSWMNQPGGFTASGGRITSVNTWQVCSNSRTAGCAEG
jgi:cytochrome bd ubiquinol oxidase subunit I